ncbi:RabGAP/TBC [Neoconidiobolus thromboides FSU 785]|nr:RabGAP/TBC [Neoconidiobolus thromboides FSU 785]
MEPLLNYYQGFHDIASVILLNLGPKNSIKSIYHLSYYYLLDYMGIDLIPVKKQLNCLFELLKLKDQQLYNFITDLEIPNYFALSWLITWGCHDIKDWNLCSRLLDFYLATSPEMPIYLACVLILHYRNEILNLEPDMPIVHTYLTNLMKNITNSNNDNNNIIDIEELISKTSLLYQQLPFDQLINNNYNELILNQNSAILNFNEFLSLSSKQEFILNYSILKNRLLIGFNQYNKQQLQSNTTLTITLVLLAMMYKKAIY